jgi:DNA mismatch endonuclease, patch repair protein
VAHLCFNFGRSGLYFVSPTCPLKIKLESRPLKLRKQLRSTPSFVGFGPSSPTASLSKRLTPSKNTSPEIMLRKALWAQGLRYRVHSPLLGRPDIVLGRSKVVVFCDGDFWHGRNWRARRAKLARGSNADYWIAKISANRRRDRNTNARLQRQGWHVVRVWESEIYQDPEKVAIAIRRLVKLRLRSRQPGKGVNGSTSEIS